MSAHEKLSARERLMEELRKYALISLYLWICFAVILVYKSSILASENIDYLPYGIALVKALVLGKFILIGDAIKVGRRADARSLLHRIAWKSFAFLLLLVVFKILEEIIIGWFHDERIAEVAQKFLSESWIEHLGPILLMLLILIPIVAATEIFRALGAAQFREALLRVDTEDEAPASTSTSQLED